MSAIHRRFLPVRLDSTFGQREELSYGVFSLRANFARFPKGDDQNESGATNEQFVAPG